MQAPPPRWKVIAWLMLGIVLAVLPFVGGASPIPRLGGLIGVGAWLLVSMMFLRRREQGGMPSPVKCTGGLPPPEDSHEYPPAPAPTPNQTTEAAPYMVRCRQGHVVDASRLSACPVCGDPIADAGTD